MISSKQIRQIVAGLSSYEAPVLSLYLNLSTGEPDRSPKAIAIRAKSTLDALPVPNEVTARVIDKIADGRPEGRTTLVVADQERLDLYPLDIEVPVEDPSTGRTEARWGAPYLTPLLIALDENQHYGLVHIDRDHARLFEVSHGGAEEVLARSRMKHPDELETEAESRRSGHPYVPVRGDAAAQLADEHVDELSRSFHADVVGHLQAGLDERDLSRLILAGPTEEVASLEREMPGPLAARIVLRLPSLTHRRASAAEVAERVREPLARLREEHERELLDRLPQHNAMGVGECLYLAQEGRLEILIVPWPLDVTVYLDSTSGLFYAEPSSPELEPAPLADLLPGLAVRFAVKLEFVLGESRDRLISEFGGMGGIRRW